MQITYRLQVSPILRKLQCFSASWHNCSEIGECRRAHRVLPGRSILPFSHTSPLHEVALQRPDATPQQLTIAASRQRFELGGHGVHHTAAAGAEVCGTAVAYVPNNVVQGLDGEATEPITEQLREPAAEEQDPEQQFAVARVLAQPVEQGVDSGEARQDANCFP